LRKILEKVIYLTFARNGILAKLEDKEEAIKTIGLKAMINTALEKKLMGCLFLISKTAEKIEGIKISW